MVNRNSGERNAGRELRFTSVPKVGAGGAYRKVGVPL
jgi:hypothetical protein